MNLPIYQPIFYQHVASFLEAYQTILLNLIGKKIDNYAILYDLDDDLWFTTHPIILIISGKQYEFLADNLHDFSLTIDQIDQEKYCKTIYLEEEINFIFKNGYSAEFDEILHQPIKNIYLLEMSIINEVVKDELGNDLVTGKHSGIALAGIEFEFENGKYFSIYNGLNENAISFQDLSQQGFYNFRKIGIQ